MKSELFIELNGVIQTNAKSLEDAAKEIWKEKGFLMKDLKNLELYYKPDEKKCYYVFNQSKGEDLKGNFDVN